MTSTPTAFSIGNGGLSGFTGLSADELYTTSSDTQLGEFYQNSLSSVDNSYLESSIWQIAYKTLYQINACIEGLGSTSGISTSYKSQLIGECLFDRAFVYFNLVNLFGSVPLVTSTNYNVNELLPRSSVDSIYLQMVSDLDSARTKMSSSYGIGNSARPNQYAASALLARVDLYLHQWNEAKELSNVIINSGIYGILNDLTGVFLTNSKEAIWQISSSLSGLETTEGFVYVPFASSIFPKYVINAPLLNAFEAGDIRRTEWLDSNVVNGSVYYYPYKYKLGYDGMKSPREMTMALRFSEQYLIRAEAEAELGDSTDSIADLNVIRSRANLPDYTRPVNGPMLSAILHERQVEFFCEWGQRWYDLKRFGVMDAVLGAEKSNWVSTDALYPIPYAEILLNPNLVQNPGYQ
jgi:hypothetical protein